MECRQNEFSQSNSIERFSRSGTFFVMYAELKIPFYDVLKDISDGCGAMWRWKAARSGSHYPECPCTLSIVQIGQGQRSARFDFSLIMNRPIRVLHYNQAVLEIRLVMSLPATLRLTALTVSFAVFTHVAFRVERFN